MPSPPALPANLNQLSPNQAPYFVTLPPSSIIIAVNFPTVVPLGTVSDPDSNSYYTYAEIVSDKGVKGSLFDPDFFQVFGFIDLSSKISLNSEGNPSMLADATNDHIGSYNITQFYGELGTLEMYQINTTYSLTIVPDSSQDQSISNEIKQAIKKYEEETKKEEIVKEFTAEITSITNGGLVTITFNEETQLNFGATLNEAAPENFNIFIDEDPEFTWSVVLVG